MGNRPTPPGLCHPSIAVAILVLTAFGNFSFCAWGSPDNGNPFLAGYFADPSVFYDSSSKTFYVFATTDGSWISFSADPAVSFSTDFVHWKLKPLVLPDFWPQKSLWAPSIMRHPKNGSYYLLYAINNATYIARCASPLGPWTNATTGTTASSAPLYKSGDMWGSNDWFDAQFFVDTNTVYMTLGGGGKCGIAKLAFAQDGNASIDDSDPRMTDGTTHKFKQLSGLTGYLEGSCMFKKDGQYFLTFSNSACQNYNVRYAVASSPIGPFTASSGIIVQRSASDNILGPGHNSILEYGGNWYIVYHRQHYQYVDVKRQTCIDQITFSDATISAGVQTQEGVWKGTGALESLVAAHRVTGDTDRAFGKIVEASSESAYKGGSSGNITEKFSIIEGFYAARYAVDRNNGTRWAPSSLPGYLIVDLGKDYTIGRCETTFEYVFRLYKYKIEYLANADAGSIAAARSSSTWRMFADRLNSIENVSPIIDSGTVWARYMKITILSANLPTAQAEIRTIIETDYADRASIVEFKVFENHATPAREKDLPDQNSKAMRFLPGGGSSSLRIFDCSGRTIRLLSIPDYRGAHPLNLSKFNFPAGIYFYLKELSLTLGRTVNCVQ